MNAYTRSVFNRFHICFPLNHVSNLTWTNFWTFLFHHLLLLFFPQISRIFSTCFISIYLRRSSFICFVSTHSIIVLKNGKYSQNFGRRQKKKQIELYDKLWKFKFILSKIPRQVAKPWRDNLFTFVHQICFFFPYICTIESCPNVFKRASLFFWFVCVYFELNYILAMIELGSTSNFVWHIKTNVNQNSKIVKIYHDTKWCERMFSLRIDYLLQKTNRCSLLKSP